MYNDNEINNNNNNNNNNNSNSNNNSPEAAGCGLVSRKKPVKPSCNRDIQRNNNNNKLTLAG